MSKGTTYVGLDVHKSSIYVHALLPGGKPPVSYRMPHTETRVRRMINELRKVAPGEVRLCYEAGPTGYPLHRQLNRYDGLTCQVVAPSLIPSKPGERVKTDRRDAAKLAECLRSGMLTEVQPPSLDDEAIRELSRTREAASKDLSTAKRRLHAFLLRQGRIFDGTKSNWTKTHLDWIGKQRFDDPHLRAAFESHWRALLQATDRLRELDVKLEAVGNDERHAFEVGVLRCLKGVSTTVAVALVSELYEMRRFSSPQQLMSFLGLTPSEHSSGSRVARGGITKAGNSRIRRLLIEVSWGYRHSKGAGVNVMKRRRDQPGWAVDIAEKAQIRLHRRFWHLCRRGKTPQVAVVAIARELVGFIWAILTEAQRRKQEASA